MDIAMDKRKIIAVVVVFVLLIVAVVCLVVFGTKNNGFNRDRVMDKFLYETISMKKEIGKLEVFEEVQDNVFFRVNYPVIGDEKIDGIIDTKVKEIVKDRYNKYAGSSKDINTYVFIDYEAYIGIDDTLSIVLHEIDESSNLDVLEDNTYTFTIDLKSGELLGIKDIFKEGYEDFLNDYLNKQEFPEDFKFVLRSDKLYVLNNEVEIPVEDLKDYLKISNILDKDYSSSVEEIKYTIVNKEFSVISENVLYNEMVIGSENLGVAKKDEVVKVFAEGNNGWSVILYNDKLAFIESKNLKEVVIEPDNEIINATGIGTRYIISDVNLMKEASVKSEILVQLRAETTVTLISQDSNWAKVKYKNKVGYVSVNYLSKTLVKKKPIKDVEPQGEIDPSKPMVALTFDDGPSPGPTTRILDTLEKYNVRATFFDLGKLMVKYPDIVKREAQLGEVATHTYSHKNLNTLSKAAIQKELDLSKKAFNEVLGYDPGLLRPPYGNANNTVKGLVDVPLINWNVDSLDWKYRNKDLILNEIDKFGDLDGKIILMHSIHSTTADTVEVLIPDLIDRGYQIVTVSELARCKGVQLEAGKLYRGFN